MKRSGLPSGAVVFVASISYRRIVDLSQEVTPDLQVFPGYPQPSFLPWTTREHHGYLAEALFLVSHSGTHIDAPWHYRPEGKKIHEMSVSQFVVRCRLLDVRPQRAKARIGARVLRRAARVAGVTPGDAVILRTGWEAMRGRDAYLLQNPGLDERGAEELVRQGVSLVGIDTASVHMSGAGDFPAHHTLLKAGVPILENLANLEDVRASTFTLVALPLRLRGATGSPVRAVALT